MNVIAIIGAKGNSTRLPRKNSRRFNSEPLIGYTIQHAHQARTVNRVIVSTEDAEIVRIAKQYGAEVPFIRPVWLTDNQYHSEHIWTHALAEVESMDSYRAVWVVGLIPTYPLRERGIIDLAVSTILDSDEEIGGCIVGQRTIRDLWTETEDGKFINLCNDIEFRSGQYRQPLYSVVEGLVTVMKADIVREGRRLSHEDNVKVITPADPRSCLDIDTPFDFWIAEKSASWSEV